LPEIVFSFLRKTKKAAGIPAAFFETDL